MAGPKQNDLGKDPIGKLLFSLALPTIAAQIVNMLYNIVDRIYIGHMPSVGVDALTGVGRVFPILMIISAFAALIGSGGAPRAAIRTGEGDNDAAERILGNCFVSLLVISAVLTAIFLLFGEKLLWMFGASGDTIQYSLEYMNIYVLGTVFVQIALGLNAFITTQGFATVSMYTVLIGAITNIILDPIFIFTLNMGVKGAALASVISQCISSIWVLRFLFSDKSKLRIKKINMKPSLKIMAPVLGLGVSPFVMQSTESLLNIAFISSLSKYGGDLAVGAMTIIASIMQMMMLPMMGLAQGAQPIISYNFGAKRGDRVKKTLKLVLISGVCFTFCYWLIIMLMPQLPVSMFTPDPALREITAWALRIYMSVGFIMGAQGICQQTFIAIGEAKISLVLALLRKIILLIPLIYILPMFLQDKVFAVFLAEPVADFIATVATVGIFAYRFPKVLAQNDLK